RRLGLRHRRRPQQVGRARSRRARRRPRRGGRPAGVPGLRPGAEDLGADRAQRRPPAAGAVPGPPRVPPPGSDPGPQRSAAGRPAGAAAAGRAGPAAPDPLRHAGRHRPADVHAVHHPGAFPRLPPVPGAEDPGGVLDRADADQASGSPPNQRSAVTPALTPARRRASSRLPGLSGTPCSHRSSPGRLRRRRRTGGASAAAPAAPAGADAGTGRGSSRPVKAITTAPMSMATPPRMMRRRVASPVALSWRRVGVAPRPVSVPLTSLSGSDLVTGCDAPPAPVVPVVASPGCVSAGSTGMAGPAGCGTGAAVAAVVAGGGVALAVRAVGSGGRAPGVRPDPERASTPGADDVPASGELAARVWPGFGAVVAGAAVVDVAGWVVAVVAPAGGAVVADEGRVVAVVGERVVAVEPYDPPEP